MLWILEDVSDVI